MNAKGNTREHKTDDDERRTPRFRPKSRFNKPPLEASGQITRRRHHSDRSSQSTHIQNDDNFSASPSQGEVNDETVRYSMRSASSGNISHTIRPSQMPGVNTTWSFNTSEENNNHVSSNDTDIVHNKFQKAISHYIGYIVESSLLTLSSEDHPIFEIDTEPVLDSGEFANAIKHYVSFIVESAHATVLEEEGFQLTNNDEGFGFTSEDNLFKSTSKESLPKKEKETRQSARISFPEVTDPQSKRVNRASVNQTEQKDQERKKVSFTSDVSNDSTSLPPIKAGQLFRPAKYQAASTRGQYFPLPPSSQLPRYPKLAFPRKWGSSVTQVEPRTVLVGFSCPPVHRFRSDQLITHSYSTLRRFYNKACTKSVEWIKVNGKR